MKRWKTGKDGERERAKTERTHRAARSLYDSEGDIDFVAMDRSTVQASNGLSCSFTSGHINESSSPSETVEDGHYANVLDSSKCREEAF